MNILTFDVEDWYNCDFISENFDWSNYEFRADKGINRILDELKKRNLKGTFFCLGWIAENHPEVVRAIHDGGHHLGCHSYQHELSSRFDDKQFRADTLRAKHMIEDIIGEEVNAFRAPGFSITHNNKWALKSLVEMGFKYDCSMFPAEHDYGGMPTYGAGVPKRIDVGDGKIIKEFPISIHKVLGKNIVFSGGGFFRFFPYPLINYWARSSDYMMTYFHPRDFDVDQPLVKNLPLKRRFKSYIGINRAFAKFQKLLDNYEFNNVIEADKAINWDFADLLQIDQL